jgi:FkbH-like protein
MKKAAFLSNINIDPLKFQLKKQCDVFFANGYDTWRQEFLNKNSDFFRFNPEFCFLILDGGELANVYETKNIETLFNYIETAAETLPLCRFFISDLDVFSMHIKDLKKEDVEFLFEYEWQKKLSDVLQKYRNIYCFPLKDIILVSGRNVAYSQKMWYMAGNRFSVAGERLIVGRIRELMRPAVSVSKKCLVLDLDNTLWGGVIGEDGIEGIKLDIHGEGARYYNFQKIIKEIKDKGILLAIASKNNKEDVEKIFSHPYMLLKKNDFSAMSIGWDTKSNGIARISNELNIGLDSLVFIDDNPVEREEVRQQLPNVAVADFPEDTAELPQCAIDVYNHYFYSFDISEEDIDKTKMYAENSLRNKEMSAFTSLDDFLISLDMKLSIAKVDSATLIRAHQMIQKTNQFNVTTKHYAEAELRAMTEDAEILLVIGRVWDKYGDNGNSILAIIRLTKTNEAEIDSFLMSCRIMNRSVEFGFLYEIEKMLVSMGVDTIFAAFIPTTKNSPASTFFETAGYEILSNDSSKKKYMFKLDNIQRRKKCFVSIV